MEQKNIIEVFKEGTDFGLIIPANTTGNDVELALAYAIHCVCERERENNPEFKTETLIEKIKGWIKCLR